MQGFISKIQRYSTKDGPGLRSTVFAAGCALRCAWCANPELLEAKKQFFYHAERCVRCGACVKLSGGTIRLTDGGCIIDRAACVHLDRCAAACFYDAYEPVGTVIAAHELAGKLLRDKAFYDQSCGGVTFSGGEAALQADFFLEVTKLLRAGSVHVALDTSGHVPWAALGPLAQAADLVLYDIKALDSAIHQRFTGADNHLILENARRIADLGKEMIVRLILVPGINDDEKEVQGRLDFVRSLASVARVDILKYHRLGAGKYRRLGLAEPMRGTPECSDELAERVKRRAAEMGFAVSIGS